VSKTLTIRLPDAQDAALTERASALGQTRSELVRELIERGLEEQSLARHIEPLRGRIRLAARATGWRKQIKNRNWR
jgi:predicted DNA-binding protein